MGEVERDEKMNPILDQTETGSQVDKNGEHVNDKGYLVNKKGDVVENKSKRVMFPKDKLGDDGELPAPFSLERFGFNYHEITGNLDKDKNGRPIIKKNKKGELVDKKGKKVNKKGFLVDNDGNIVDKFGRKKFEKGHLTDTDDLPQLFNYDAKKFNIKDVIGDFDKDPNGDIILQKDKNN